MRRAGWRQGWLPGVLLLGAGLQAATAEVCITGHSLAGRVLDQTEAAIVGASVTLQPKQGPARQTFSNAEGRFSFPCVVGRENAIHVEAAGFTPRDTQASGPSSLIVTLVIAAIETNVAVGDDANSLDTDHGAGTRILTGKDVQDLADDPDDLKRQLQVLAATSGGAPGQAVVTVDGFQNSSQLPPKASIASIRVNPDMFSSEYEEPPYRGGRIEIDTKPGLDSHHGAVFYSDSDSRFNANDPFSTTGTPAGKRRYGFELSGPIVHRRSDFALALEKRDIDEFNVVNAVVINGDGVPAPMQQSVSAPQRLWITSARSDWQLHAKNIATVSYTGNVSSLGNQGVGGLSLEESGYGMAVSEHNLRLTDIATLNASLLHETRVAYTWKNTVDTPNSAAASVQVAGAFTGGGATSQRLENRERDLEVDDDLMITRAAHSLKIGAEALSIFVHANDPDTFNGAYTFGGGLAPNLDGTRSSVITGLEQYRRALAALPGGVPTTYQVTTGDPLVLFTQWRLALYAQDSWKLSPRLSVATGLRYALETSPGSFANFAPRVGMAWSPDKKQKWVIHLRAGLFASPVRQATTLEAYRLNGIRQVETLVYAPDYSAPLTPVAGSLTVATTRAFARHVGESPSFQSQAGLECELPHHWHVQANLFYAAAWDDLRSRNINAPVITGATTDPLLGPRPFAANRNMLEYQQTGNLHGTVTFLGVDQHSYKRFGVFIGYLHYDLVTDADTAANYPQSSYSDRGEFARASWESTNRIFALGQVNLPRKVSLATQFDAASGLPYDVTTGMDNNGDGIFNDRPSYASAAGSGVYATCFGLLSTAAVNGNLPRNAGTMPATVHLDANLSRAFVISHAQTGDRHETLTLNARSANLINHTNVTAVGTVVGSPTFAQPLAAETARRLEVGARFTFNCTEVPEEKAMKTQAMLVGLLLAVAAAGYSQTPTTTLPTEPAGITYRYFPRQFVQWVGPELPYSMVELDVDDRGPKPLYDAVLTDRATNKRVHYTNQQVEVEVDTFGGAEVHLVPMQFDSPAEAAKGATYQLRFATETGVPVTWQFVQGSEFTEQGGGMTPVATPTPVLVYREQAAVAGQGTALKVGNVTSTADIWQEISQPPYFIAYHGALSQDVHTLLFAPRSIEWKIAPSTAAIAAAADWTLTSADRRVLSAHVDSFANGLATVHETHRAIGTVVSLDARQTPTGWALERLRYAPAGALKGDHGITISFKPGEAGALSFDVVAGRKTHLASGAVTMSPDGGESWTLTQPVWARRAPVVASETESRGQPAISDASPAH